MVQLYGKNWTARQLQKYIGDISQVGGVRPILLNEGTGRGLAAAEFDTGTGFRFTVLLDRGMDICSASYQGHSLCWRSPTGEMLPSYFEPTGLEWLRTFFGGLLTTCGPSFLGAPCEDEGEQLGLHGRWTNMSASKIKYDEHWDGSDYLISVEGHMREARVFGRNLHVTRKISSRLGENRLIVEDSITNYADTKAPLMILYHCNIGWPLLDENACLYIPSDNPPIPVDEFAAEAIDKVTEFHLPTRQIAERCYYHATVPDKKGVCHVALVNPTLDGGLGVYLRYPHHSLPEFTEWKMMGEGTYVLGMEPGNCRAETRSQARAQKRLPFLAPGATAKFHLEIGVLPGAQAIDKFLQQHQLQR